MADTTILNSMPLVIIAVPTPALYDINEACAALGITDGEAFCSYAHGRLSLETGLRMSLWDWDMALRSFDDWDEHQTQRGAQGRRSTATERRVV